MVTAFIGEFQNTANLKAASEERVYTPDNSATAINKHIISFFPFFIAIFPFVRSYKEH